jgi:hypothetical protein
MKKLLILILLVMLFFSGCDDPLGYCPKNPFGLSTRSISVGKNGGTATVTAKLGAMGIYEVIAQGKTLSKGDFEIVCMEEGCSDEFCQNKKGHRIKVIGEWFEVVEVSGHNLSFTVDRNDTGIERSLSVGVWGGICYSTITLTQKAK